MNCERAEAALSEQLDGERLPTRVSEHLEEHLATCSGCREFLAGARRLREGVRIRSAEDVPDLVDSIMARVGAERRARHRGWVRPRHRPPVRRIRPFAPSRPEPASPEPVRSRPSRRFRPELARVGVALMLGAIVGSAVTGSGVLRRSPPSPVLAQELPGKIYQAATRLSGYHARFFVSEWHFQKQLPLRRFSVDVWFSAPERFRMDVADHTPYPSRSWPRNDLSLIVNGPTWYLSGPGPCPTEAYPNCPLGATQAHRVDNRLPFSAAAPMPSDIVLPLTTLADADRLTVLGKGKVLGRPALRVQMRFRQAGALFAFLRQGGAWRPFFPNDRVVLWLDARNWFPLAYRVYPARGQERRRWAAGQGLPPEPPRRDIFSASVLYLDEKTPDPSVFTVPLAPASSEGAQTVSLSQAAKKVGFRSVIPTDTAGLKLYTTVIPSAPADQPKDQTLIAFSSGLAWLKVRETPSWRSRTPFGQVSPHAQAVQLPGGGQAYYEPGTSKLGRRLSVHAKGIDVYLETNLSKHALLKVAASLPVSRPDIPTSWQVQRAGGAEVRRLPFHKAASKVPFPVALPGALPAGYALASTELVQIGDSVGLNLDFQQANADLSGRIRLHMEGATVLPPASSAHQFEVVVAGSPGRFTPDRSELEWIQDGVYYELDGPGLGLPDLLGIAQSIPSPQAGAPTGSAAPGDRNATPGESDAPVGVVPGMAGQ